MWQAGMPWAPGCEVPLEARTNFLTLRGIFDGQKLRDDASHGVAADDGLLDI